MSAGGNLGGFLSVSYRLSAAVWGVKIPATSKLVLLRLAEFADEDGLCWPSATRVAEDTGLCERMVRKAFATIVTAGLASRERREGRTDTYRLTLSGQLTPERHSGVSEETPRNHVPDTPEPRSITPERHSVTPAPRSDEPIITNHEPIKEPVSTHAPRRRTTESHGARLPDGWEPDSSGEEFSRDLGLDPAVVLPGFADYWRAASGARGRKADWPATWRNWCRNQVDRNRGPPRHVNGTRKQSNLSQFIDGGAVDLMDWAVDQDGKR